MILDPLKERFELLGIKYWLSHDEFGPGIDLPEVAAELELQVDGAGIHGNADHKPGLSADRIAAWIESAIETVHHVGEANAVNVENGR